MCEHTMSQESDNTKHAKFSFRKFVNTMHLYLQVQGKNDNKKHA